jgi:O-antigen ligase
MFVLLAALISYSLLTFGAVVPNSWLLLAILWTVAIAGLLVTEAISDRRWDLWFLLSIVLSILVLWLLPPRFALGLVAGIWASLAARRSQKGTLRFLQILIIIGVLEALLGLVQFFISPGWIFGYINPFNRSSGTLINRNHFAGLLELLIPATFGYAYMSARRFGRLAQSYVYLLAGAFMGLALLFSVSRMGIFSFLSTLFFLGLLLQLRKSQRGRATALALGMGALLAAGALWIGIDVIVKRYSELAGEDALFREGRIVIFSNTTRMIKANPLGVGIGAFQDRFRQYQTFRTQFLFDHAHNDYLEAAAEWGIPIAAVFWAFILFALVRAVRQFLWDESPERRGILLACIGAIFSLLIHSFADFNLQIPSNAMLFFSFVGISLGMARPLRSQ